MAGQYTLAGFANMLANAALALPSAQQTALEQAAVLIETEAKAEIGHYQGAAGPFAAWAPLKPETIARKRNGDTPLLETGDMRDSIGHVVLPQEAHIGSDNDKALWQELGTSRGIPPRSFLGGAAVRKSADVARIIGQAVHGALIGGGTTTKLP